jgi:hypothetical protein
MTISIADAVTQIMAQAQAPVILIDTCNLLDLFRSDPAKPRVSQQEIRAAADFLDLLNATPNTPHLIVPELIPREYTDHAGAIQRAFGGWTELHDTNQGWVFDASACVALTVPAPNPIHPHGLAARLRALADNLLGKAKVLERDQACLDRAVVRLINKTRPSHKKEMKDSMNLEQCLELSRRLQSAGFVKSRVWVSSNTNDFAQGPTSTQLNSELQADFTAAGLEYFTSIRGAFHYLRGRAEI